jgi:nicotinamide mononucleotide transporter
MNWQLLYDASSPLFYIGAYPVSLLELVGTLTGLCSVWLATKVHIALWPMGIINVICFFLIFYQTQLYADALLQIYYFVISIYGWIYWKRKYTETLVSKLKQKARMNYAVSALIACIVFGYLMGHIHEYLPILFSKPSAFPYLDGALAILSVYATYMMAKGFYECWWVWILVDISAGFLYIYKDIYLMATEYFIFALLAVQGVYKWSKKIAS